MIHAETVDGRIDIKCGNASGMDLICEAAALVTSVVRAVSSPDGNKDVVDEEVAKTAFRYIFTGACAEIEERTGIDVSPHPTITDDDADDDDEDDSEETIIAKAIPMDSDTGRKLMELLGIDPEEVKSGDDDETVDDIPKFLF